MSKTEILAELPRLTPADRAEVQAKLDELAGDVVDESGERRRAHLDAIFADPAFGIWRDRADFPDDGGEAARLLRRQVMHRGSPAQRGDDA